MQLLAGLKVIDVTAWAYVPAAGGVLAHWGADVIKVEPPEGGDPIRQLGGSLEPGRSSTFFKHYSRGKRSIGLDLASDEGREILYKLVKEADVFLTSYLPATRRKLKIDVADLQAVNPKIIYVRGSGYGPKGPEAERPGYDLISWWCRGSLAQSSMDQSGATTPPMMVGHGDGMSGLTLAGGICAALLHRERTGQAPVVDGSLLGTAVWFNGPALIAAQSNPVPRTFAPAPPSAAPSMGATTSWYQTKDHRFVYMFFLGDSNRDFVDLCEHLGRPELGSDERFADSRARLANKDELKAIIADVVAQRTLDEWKQTLVTAKGAWCAVQTPEEVYDDPQTTANGFLRYVDYPGGGLRVPVPPIQFDEEAGDPPPAPDFAAHTDEIMAELGFPTADVERLRASGVVR